MSETFTHPLLNQRDYQDLAVLMGTNARTVKNKLRDRDGLSTWTVAQLRTVIKFLREKHAERNQPFPNWLSLNGRKARLIEIVLQCMGVGTRPPGQMNYPNTNGRGAGLYNSNNLHNNMAAQIAAAQAYRSGLARPYPNLQQQWYNAANFSAHQETPDVTKICQSKEFNGGRSPFFTVFKRYTACPVLPSRRSKFSIDLEPDIVRRLHAKEGIALHLRLFDSVNATHVEWNKNAGVSCQINNAFKHFQQKPSNATANKAKGHHIVKALDISSEATTKMQIVLFSQYALTGIIAVELMTVHPIKEVAQRVKRRCLDTKKCEVCGETTGLLRCSRCKSAWYCGIEHQGEDWAKHQKICCPYTLKPKLRSLHTPKNDGDDELICGESRVSLRCPLTICRIQTPVRGADCLHPQCLDLMGFLGFSHRTSIWQCPVCMKALAYEDILVDEKMSEILEKAKEDVDQVRLYPDGTFVPITLEEIREEDRKSQARGRKRKRVSTTDANAAAPVVVPAPLPLPTAADSIDLT